MLVRSSLPPLGSTTTEVPSSASFPCPTDSLLSCEEPYSHGDSSLLHGNSVHGYAPKRRKWGNMAKRSFAIVVTLIVAASCSGGSDDSGDSATPTPQEGISCTEEGSTTGYSAGTLECTRDGERLEWRRIDQRGADSGSDSSGDVGDVSLEGTSCQKVGDTTGLPNGTAECVDESGSLVWRRIGGPAPVLPDGVVCGSPNNPKNPLARPDDNENARASLDAFPVECVFPYTPCAPEGDQEQYQWFRTDFSLAVDPRNPNRLLVGVERLGIFESLDRGTTWAPLSEEGIIHALAKADGTVCWTQTFDIVFDPSVPGRIYLPHGGGGTVESGIWQSRGAGLYRSDDDGETWELLTAPDMNAYVAGFAIDPTSSDTLYMGTSSAPQTDGSAPVAYVDEGLLYRSDDGGRTWRELPTGWGARTVGAAVLVDPIDRNTVLLGVFQYADGAADGAPTGTGLGPGWYRSTDGGRSWTPHGSGEGARSPVSYRIAVSPDGSVIVNSYDQLQISRDGGATWETVSPLRWVPTFDPSRDSNRLYAILSAEMAGTDQDQFTVSTDAGRSWKTLGSLPAEIRVNEWNEPPLYRRATPSNIVVDPTDSSVIYVTGAGGAIARSLDGGSTWELLTTWESFSPSDVEIR